MTMRKTLLILFLILLVNSAYIAAFAFPTIFYMGNVLLHVGLGIAVATLSVWFSTRNREFLRGNILAMGCFAVVAFLGGYLTYFGAVSQNRWAVIAHVSAAFVGTIALIPFLKRYASRRTQTAFLLCLLSLAVLPAGAWGYRKIFPDLSDRIRNPAVVPASMAEEGGGPKSIFWPSSAKTNIGGVIPSNFFMESKACGECHRDIYRQWNSSMHHFASFNNQFYRKSIEYMQSIAGTSGTKWCAGCHDHAVFFNGRFDRPIKEQIDTPEAQTGLGCTSCHSIVHVDSSMGNGGFTIAYPPLHELASSKNPYMKALDHFLTYLNPEPHRRTFMKPFMRQDSAEFCATCHKVHLDVPVNNYRWLRGFNDYDNWQASGVSGQGARSFYYPDKPMACSGCHMPEVKSNDPGNKNGVIHSHRFPAANMAVAQANQDAEQMGQVEKFLKSGFITVDIFAASLVENIGKRVEMKRRSSDGPQLNSTFAVGEEAEQQGPVFIREVGKVAAPIDTAGAMFEPGSTVRLDTVVRTRKIGHFFPGGTVDSFDVWLEVQARDATGRVIFWNGRVEDGGRGAVDKGAHFYRSFLLDAAGNEIDKRNAFQARSVLYVRLIPPGAADVAHYQLTIPKNAVGPISVSAKLNYRKFSHYYTQFAYAGEPKAGQSPELVSVHFDNREFSFDRGNIPANVSGKIRNDIPDLPIVTLATAQAELSLGKSSPWQPVARKRDRERWNDWGIGLLLQGDLKGAEFAFGKVTEAEPDYADGWLNVARALIQEGETDAAKAFVERAMAIDANLGRVWFFRAMIQKTDGDYEAALTSLRKVQSLYPRDRVALNQSGRILFLQRKYAEAVKELQKCLQVDPEDVQAHYNLMLAYRGLGHTEKARREETLFQRFKADEASQAITAKPRLLSAEANNERQPIHDHASAAVER